MPRSVVPSRSSSRSRLVRLALGCLLLLQGLVLAPARADEKKKADEKKAPAPRSYVLRAGSVYTGSGGLLHDVTLVVRDGKIEAIGRDVDAPADLPVLDYSAQTLLPGLVAFNLPLAGSNPEPRSLAPEILALDAYDLYARHDDLLRGGVTTAGVSTGSSRLLSGRGLVVKTGAIEGEETTRIVRAAGGFEVHLGEISKRPPSIYEPPVLASPDDPFRVLPIQPPVTRAGALHALDHLLGQARAYDEARRRPETSVDFEPGLEALRDLVQGRDYLKVEADRAIDLLALIRLARKHQVKIVFEGAREAYRVEEVLREDGIPVILPGSFLPGSLSGDDLRQTTLTGTPRDGMGASLMGSGLRVGLKSPGSASLLLYQAIDAVRLGVPVEQALRMITTIPAEVLGVSDRVGSLEVGKDADFVVFGDDPFASGGKPVATFVQGAMVFPRVKDQPSDITLIRCGEVHPVSRAPIPGGVIVLKKGKIHAVGDASLLGAFPEAKQVIDATDQVVIPGMIDAGSQLGLHADRIYPGRTRERPRAGGGRPGYRLLDALDPRDPDLDVVSRAGFTTVLLTPDPVGSFSGQISAVRLRGAGKEPEVIEDPVAFLMGSVSSRSLAAAQKYHQTWEKYEKDLEEYEKKKAASEKKSPSAAESPEKPEKKQPEKKEAKPAEKKEEPKPPVPPVRNNELEVLRPVFQGKLPVVIHARAESNLKGIFTGFTDKIKTSVTIGGLTQLSSQGLDELRRRKIGLLLSPEAIASGAMFPRELDRVGFPHAFASGSATGVKDLPFHLSYAVREGLTVAAALRAVTLFPAQFFGLEKKVGSIEPGKDADLVFLSGRPFAVTTRVTGVMVKGEYIHREGAGDPAQPQEKN